MGTTSSAASGGLGQASDERLRAEVAVRLHTKRKKDRAVDKDVRPLAPGRRPMPTSPKRPDPHADRKALADAFRRADGDKDGRVSFSEFKKAAAVAGVKAADGRLKEVFGRFDKDRNGQIDITEFMDFMSPMSGLQVLGVGLGAGPSSTGLTAGAAVASPAKSPPRKKARTEPAEEVPGPAAEKVLAKVARAVYERELSLQQAFQRWDLDKSGNLDLRELSNALEELGLGIGSDGARAAFAAFDVDGNGRLSCWEFVQGLSSFVPELGQTERKEADEQNPQSHSDTVQAPAPLTALALTPSLPSPLSGSGPALSNSECIVEAAEERSCDQQADDSPKQDQVAENLSSTTARSLLGGLTENLSSTDLRSPLGLERHMSISGFLADPEGTRKEAGKQSASIVLDVAGDIMNRIDKSRQERTEALKQHRDGAADLASTEGIPLSQSDKRPSDILDICGPPLAQVPSLQLELKTTATNATEKSVEHSLPAQPQRAGIVQDLQGAEDQAVELKTLPDISLQKQVSLQVSGSKPANEAMQDEAATQAPQLQRQQSSSVFAQKVQRKLSGPAELGEPSADSTDTFAGSLRKQVKEHEEDAKLHDHSRDEMPLEGSPDAGETMQQRNEVSPRAELLQTETQAAALSVPAARPHEQQEQSPQPSSSVKKQQHHQQQQRHQQHQQQQTLRLEQNQQPQSKTLAPGPTDVLHQPQKVANDEQTEQQRLLQQPKRGAIDEQQEQQQQQQPQNGAIDKKTKQQQQPRQSFSEQQGKPQQQEQKTGAKTQVRNEQPEAKVDAVTHGIAHLSDSKACPAERQALIEASPSTTPTAGKTAATSNSQASISIQRPPKQNTSGNVIRGQSPAPAEDERPSRFAKEDTHQQQAKDKYTPHEKQQQNQKRLEQQQQIPNHLETTKHQQQAKHKQATNNSHKDTAQQETPLANRKDTNLEHSTKQQEPQNLKTIRHAMPPSTQQADDKQPPKPLTPQEAPKVPVNHQQLTTPSQSSPLPKPGLKANPTSRTKIASMAIYAWKLSEVPADASNEELLALLRRRLRGVRTTAAEALAQCMDMPEVAGCRASATDRAPEFPAVTVEVVQAFARQLRYAMSKERARKLLGGKEMSVPAFLALLEEQSWRATCSSAVPGPSQVPATHVGGGSQNVSGAATAAAQQSAMQEGRSASLAKPNLAKANLPPGSQQLSHGLLEQQRRHTKIAQQVKSLPRRERDALSQLQSSILQRGLNLEAAASLSELEAADFLAVLEGAGLSVVDDNNPSTEPGFTALTEDEAAELLLVLGFGGLRQADGKPGLVSGPEFLRLLQEAKLAAMEDAEPLLATQAAFEPPSKATFAGGSQLSKGWASSGSAALLAAGSLGHRRWLPESYTGLPNESYRFLRAAAGVSTSPKVRYHPGKLSSDAEGSVRRAFNGWDANGDGKLSKQELLGVLRRLDPRFTPESVSRMFKAADLDRDGAIDYREFTNYLFH